jgi:antirestriction protein
MGEYDSEEDFASQLVDECYSLPEFAISYFDYEKFARDLFIGDYWFSDGFVFNRV